MTVTERGLPRRLTTSPLARRVTAIVGRGRTGPWNRDATTLTVLTVLLLCLGIVMSFSASVVGAAVDGDPFSVFQRQLVWAALGIPVFLAAANLDHRIWRPLSWLLMPLALLMLLLVLTPAGLTRFGSTRWLAFGPLVIQPTELAKLATMLWLADVFTRKREKGIDVETAAHMLLPALPLLAVEAILIILEPDLGTTILMGFIVALVLWIQGIRVKWMASLGALAAIGATTLALTEGYRLGRIRGWLDPEADPLGDGFQLLQALFAMGDGGVFGLGLGASRGKWNWIPNPDTDFIFAIIAEELGLVGALVTLALFAGVLVVGMRISRLASDDFGRTVAFVLTAWLVGQALINVGTVTGLLPITGVTLPLVSVGGSSLVSTLLGLGILVSIARRPEPIPGTSPEHRPEVS